MAQSSEKSLGVVYVVRGDDGLIKIGLTNTIDGLSRRLLHLKATLITAFITDNPAWLEHMLHMLFSPRRVRGEWFELTEDDVAFLRMVSNAGIDLIREAVADDVIAEHVAHQRARKGAR